MELDVLAPLKIEESITGRDFRNFLPYNGSQLSNSEEVRICVNHCNFAHLSDSCLYIEGSLTDIKPAALDKVKLVKNFPMFLFSEVRLEINSQVIDTIRNPGIVSTIKNYCLMSQSEKAAASEFFWGDGIIEIEKRQPNFSCCIPLKRIFGLCQDYRKVIIYSKIELVLVRARSDVDIFVEPTEDAAVKVNLSKIAWKLPIIEVSDFMKLRMSKILEEGVELNVAFRAVEYFENPNLGTSNQLNWQIKTSNGLEKPLYVIVGLQTNRRDAIDKDMTGFDHCNLRDAKLYLNTLCTPYEGLNLNFDSDQFSNAYHMFTKFRQSYLGEGESCITSAEFKKTTPLIVFDVSKTPLELKSAPVDVRLELSFEKNVTPTTSAQVILIYDKVISYSPFTGIVLRQT